MGEAGSMGFGALASMRLLRAFGLSGAHGSQGAARLGSPSQRGRYALIFTFDAVASLLALQLAFWLRFEGEVPAHYAVDLSLVSLVLVASRLASNAFARLHRWAFRLAGGADALRVIGASLAGTLLFVTGTYLLGRWLPRTVYALEFFLATTAFGAARFLPRVGLRWAGIWARTAAGVPRAVIIGAGHSAELLARDLLCDRHARYQLVGFVDENPHMLSSRIDGTPVLGAARDLPSIIRRHRITAVLLADAQRSAACIREIVELCATSRVAFKIAPASWAHMEERLSVAMLDDMSAEDLLPRDAVAFDEKEIGALVAGRRALVTGAGGTIGGELSRQLVRHGVQQLVMVDMNENELYLRRLALAEEYPNVDIRAEVADVREAEPLHRLGERYRPQDVFHAAAHKHVPLMEDAPAEAVKNNVFGTLNAAQMADDCGVERFVLISTDKAVNPTSVMGATKRVAELVVRDIGRCSRTRMTAVRFGNVLGSAGSVVPIFKRQIARGGPVTVTHAECTRYFMTVPEAVGLVMLAGLGGHGELCVLDMGEPIRIAELARSMITLSGHVPGEDIAIVYTGLRPGEKLNEEVLTEQEEKSVVVRNRIQVTHSPPPPLDLCERIPELRRLANAGDDRAILAALHTLVPTYRSTATKHGQPPGRDHARVRVYGAHILPSGIDANP